MPTNQTAETAPHDYEPGETTGAMHTDPDCRICGQPKRSRIHEGRR